MTNQQHPIIPSPKLVQQWFADWESSDNEEMSFAEFAIPRAAQWAADQELEACCELLVKDWGSGHGKRLRKFRRPKPPTLKEQSLALIDVIQGNEKTWNIRDLDVIRRALKALDD